jgi:uncharacterized protein (TIGR03118 family)
VRFCYEGIIAPSSEPPPGAFVDPEMQKGFAPFGIQAIQIGLQTQIFVTYAKQPAHDDVAHQGYGIVSRFSTDGTFLGRVATRGQLNSPWGLALAPSNFGPFSGDLLVGNFGNGQILAYQMQSDGTFEYHCRCHSQSRQEVNDNLRAFAASQIALSSNPQGACTHLKTRNQLGTYSRSSDCQFEGTRLAQRLFDLERRESPP